MRIELHPSADDEFAAQVEYFDDQQPGLGRRFYDEVMACLEWIAGNPTVPRLRKEHRRVNLKIFPFYVAYTIEADLIWVLAVSRGSRRPGYWRSRRGSG